MDRSGPIGFFDSGLGGLSVLKGTRALLPGEDYLYYGDSANAPYGVRTVEQVRQLSCHAAKWLLDQGAKAIVIACNTATSAAAQHLRQTYPELTIIGTEPAIKPAVQACPGGRILVMATEMTLHEQKFLDLSRQFSDAAQIISVPCSGLMEFVEQGVLQGAEVEAFLHEKLSAYLCEPAAAVVLGCTHYPFLRSSIEKIVGPKTMIFDSADGVARQLKRRLEAQNLLRDRTEEGCVTIANSSRDPAFLRLSSMLLESNL